jgi:hypothetical protein
MRHTIVIELPDDADPSAVEDQVTRRIEHTLAKPKRSWSLVRLAAGGRVPLRADDHDRGEPVKMTWQIIQRGEVIGTVEAPTKREAQVIVAQRFGDGPWVMPR